MLHEGGFDEVMEEVLRGVPDAIQAQFEIFLFASDRSCHEIGQFVSVTQLLFHLGHGFLHILIELYAGQVQANSEILILDYRETNNGDNEKTDVEIFLNHGKRNPRKPERLNLSLIFLTFD